MSAPRRTRDAANTFAALPSPLLFLVLFVAEVASHATLLRLPYFWDEGGYYIPAALDFYQRGALIPEFTNAHPPLPNVLLGLFWHIAGYHILGTRLLVCAVAAAALLAVLRLAQTFLGPAAALATCLLTGVYSIWYAQSTLAHADIFAACFTLWGFVIFFRPEVFRVHGTSPSGQPDLSTSSRELLALAGLFSLAALAKETSILQPAALAALELFRHLRVGSHTRQDPARQRETRRAHAGRAAALLFPVLPLALWFLYHRLHTGFTFGNPEFLRYNATANLSVLHVASAARYRFLHLFWQREIWVPLVIAVLCLFTRGERGWPSRFGLPRTVLNALGLLVAANWLAFSILGGALLTRYLLPIYPLLLLFCVAAWKARTPQWPVFAAATAALFVSSWWINPPTYFAPEDNLAYRDMIVVHQEAINFVRARFPEATILTAWPVAADLVRPELGYVDRPLRVTSLDNFTLPEIRRAAAEPEKFDTAIAFATHFVSPSFEDYLRTHPNSRRTEEYNRTRDLFPAEIARLLGGEVLWQHDRNGEWAAVLRFPRSYQARLLPPSGNPMLESAHIGQPPSKTAVLQTLNIVNRKGKNPHSAGEALHFRRLFPTNRQALLHQQGVASFSIKAGSPAPLLVAQPVVDTPSAHIAEENMELHEGRAPAQAEPLSILHQANGDPRPPMLPLHIQRDHVAKTALLRCGKVHDDEPGNFASNLRDPHKRARIFRKSFELGPRKTEGHFEALDIQGMQRIEVTRLVRA